MPAAIMPAATPEAAKSGHTRWIICGLLFLATTVNYVDRQVIGILKPYLAGELHWTENDYANIIFAFQCAYAFSYMASGWIVDRLGAGRTYSVAVTVWSLAAMAHAATRSVAGFTAARLALGLGEGANFPAAVKVVGEWFPQKERSLANGAFIAGTNVGALVTPLTVPWITLRYGWRWAFILTGLLGFLWLGAWLLLYHRPEEHPSMSESELAYIRSGPAPPEVRVPWGKLFRHRQMWAVALGKFMTDPIWWLYLFWVPDFLHKTHGITLLNIGLPLVVIYVVADLGSIGGGWLSSSLIKRGWSVNSARKSALLICALGVVPIMFAARAQNLWVAVGVIALAAASHQGWSANMYTLPSDLFPRSALGSVTGIAGCAGAVGGMMIAKFVGYTLERTGSYFVVFLIAAFAYLAAFVMVQLLSPRLEPAKL